MRAFFAGALLVASVAGIAYLSLAVHRTFAFGKRRARAVLPPHFTPPITVLKPLCGLDPGLFENLSSLCDQDYPNFQVIFGVRDAQDPAIEVARSVIQRYPNRDISLVVNERVSAANLKMANVLNMMPSAKHDIIVLADSDVRVMPTYLRAVTAPFTDALVGAVTCLYRGTPSQGSIASELGAMFVAEQFAPSVLVATALSPMDFCLGATMAVTKRALDAIGGFEAIGSYLADDQMLGKLVQSRGFRVELSPEVVETSISDETFKDLWDHEIRWARTVHRARPLGYSFSFITYGFPMALAFAAIASNAKFSFGVVGLVLALRLGLHYVSRYALGVRTPDAPWLVPLRDVFGLAVWSLHFFGRNVRWRSRDFTITRDGRLERTNLRG